MPVENWSSRNFRSQAGLVEWVNAVFPHVLGLGSDPWRGTVGFARADATRDALPGPAATVEAFVDGQREAAAIVGRVRAALAAGAGDVAVLVRARAHLDALLPALRAADIPFAAVELDALAERQAVLDLTSLAHALVQPADRHAWLALLRAPWCGLTLPDLFAVVEAADARHDGFVAALISEATAVPGVSDDGARRLARVASVLAPALAARGRASLAARVRGAWLALGGPATQRRADRPRRGGALLRPPCRARGCRRRSRLVGVRRRARRAPRDAGSAGRRARAGDDAAPREGARVRHGDPARPRPRSQPQRAGGPALAPPARRVCCSHRCSRGAATTTRSIAYLKLLAAGEESAELARLLYVGCTRAKRRLHLTAVLEARAAEDAPLAWGAPPAGSALAKFWGVPAAPIAPPPASVAHPVASAAAAAARPAAARVGAIGARRRRSRRRRATATPRVAAVRLGARSGRHTGTVAHRLFAQIAREGLAAWNPARVASLAGRIRAEFAAEGVDEAELARAAGDVAGAVAGLLADPRGRWLFDPEHADAAAEWSLAGIESHAIVHVVIDRTFLADGVRWIVDFKTGTHEGADVAAFLDREVERYREQLERYARFVAELDPRPIRLALYHPLFGAGGSGRFGPDANASARQKARKSAKIQSFASWRHVSCGFFAACRRPPTLRSR